MQQLSLDVHLVRPPSFDNFVAGPNLELIACLKAVLAGERPAKCILVWGEPGSGKSHLLDAMRSAIDTPSCAGICLLDDCNTLDSEGQAHWFNEFITQAGQPGALILASANQAPLHLKLRADLRTRLGSGLVFQLKRLDDDQKAQALRRHANGRQIALPEEVLRHLLRHYPRDIRSLMQILDSLDRFAFEQKRALSLPLLRHLESQPQQQADLSSKGETEPPKLD
jgi:DnaA-homolog protein